MFRLTSGAMAGLLLATLASAASLPASRSHNANADLPKLVFNSGADLAQLRLRAVESWTEAGARDDSSEVDEVYFHHGVPIEVETAANGRALGAHRQARQTANARKQENAIDAAGIGAALNLSGEIWTMAEFEANFHWTVQPAADCDGRRCMEVDFVPTPGHHAGSRIGSVLEHCSGTLWVDAATGQILRGQFHSLSAVNFGAGILAHIGHFEGTFAMQPAPGGAWVLREVVVKVRGRKLFHSFNGTERMLYTIAN